LKTNLEAFRVLVIYFSKNKGNQVPFMNDLSQLFTLVNSKDENEDFFKCFLSIKIKSRTRAISQIGKTIKSGFLTSRMIITLILPLADYIVFGGKEQIKNKKNSVSYN
jgi:hypothetical protein